MELESDIGYRARSFVTYLENRQHEINIELARIHGEIMGRAIFSGSGNEKAIEQLQKRQTELYAETSLLISIINNYKDQVIHNAKINT